MNAQRVELAAGLPILLHAAAAANAVYERLSTSGHPSLMRCTLNQQFVGYSGARVKGVPDETLKQSAWAEAAYALMVVGY